MDPTSQENYEAKRDFYKSIYDGGEISDSDVYRILDRKPEKEPTGEVRTVYVPEQLPFDVMYPDA